MCRYGRVVGSKIFSIHRVHPGVWFEVVAQSGKVETTAEREIL